ncbi:hypothetical protein [Allomuricauda sp. NBRC 101325]|uniref:hypothetical protein n=1 Tax=Allomuricauda sp. NBRC 101325 TaxID=1113758 RepID=UPI0024A1098A|nr:hypothetical protein [Muricauda sp. NBRC 101325]GLU45607.1 hypothetical protein Musp01_32310 [Muricauda sp. NBRC 101325]
MEKVLDRKIKIIWDFRGPGAAKIAEHYKKHLEEFVMIEELKFDLSGVEHFGPTHSIAFLVVAEFELKEIREILKPHRGQVYTGNI